MTYFLGLGYARRQPWPTSSSRSLDVAHTLLLHIFIFILSLFYLDLISILSVISFVWSLFTCRKGGGELGQLRSRHHQNKQVKETTKTRSQKVKWPFPHLVLVCANDSEARSGQKNVLCGQIEPHSSSLPYTALWPHSMIAAAHSTQPSNSHQTSLSNVDRPSGANIAPSNVVHQSSSQISRTVEQHPQVLSQIIS